MEGKLHNHTAVTVAVAEAEVKAEAVTGLLLLVELLQVLIALLPCRHFAQVAAGHAHHSFYVQLNCSS